MGRRAEPAEEKCGRNPRKRSAGGTRGREVEDKEAEDKDAEDKDGGGG